MNTRNLPSFGRAMLALLAGLASCTTVTAPLEEGPASNGEDGVSEYLVGVTHLRYGPEGEEAFNRYIDDLTELVSAAPGNVGTTFRANVLTRDRWTLSTWTDPASMGAFVASPEHIAAIREIMPTAEIARTVTVTIDADDYPLSWDEALDILEEQGIDR